MHFRAVPLTKFRTNFDRFYGDKGFCRTDEHCPLKGTHDLFPCTSAPFIITLPHFLETDPSLLENIASGLYPNKKDHEIFASIDLVY